MSLLTLWRQSRALLVANLKSRYRKTFAGFIWVILNPFILYGTQSYVFHTVLKLQVYDYNIFLLSGLLPWTFATSSFQMCVTSYVSSGRLLKSFPVHPTVYLLAQIMDNFVNFIAAFLVIGLPLLFFEKASVTHFLFLVFPTIPLLISVFALSWILALIQVFFRDTNFILGFAVNILYFITPVFYPVEFVPQRFRWVITINPLNAMIEPFRAAIYDFNPARLVHTTLVSTFLAGIFLGVALILWRRTKNLVYFHL